MRKGILCGYQADSSEQTRKNLFFLLCFSCLLFSDFTLADLSDKQKREFIEQLAQPLPEKRVFYRWQSETSRSNLITERILTEERLQYFLNMEGGVLAGPGLYVAEDLHSSKRFGKTIMQVEADEGMNYVDLTDRETLRKLRQEGITIKDVYNLNPKVAVKYNTQHWVFKAREGVTFQPFSSKGIPLDELDGPAMEKHYFRESIREDILKRAES